MVSQLLHEIDHLLYEAGQLLYEGGQQIVADSHHGVWQAGRPSVGKYNDRRPYNQLLYSVDTLRSMTFNLCNMQ